jgi:hypothetical protein
MGLKEWLRHPWKCICAVIDGHLHADCPNRIELASYIMEVPSRASIHHVIPEDDADTGRAYSGRHLRVADQRPYGWPDRYLPDSRQPDDTLDFPGPA